MALPLDVIARRQVATTPPLASNFLYHASFHSSPSSLSSRLFCCLRGRLTAVVSLTLPSGNRLHVTALKWRTGAAEIARLRDLPLHRSQVISSVYGQHEAGAEIAPGKDRLWPAMQWSHASIRASSTSVCMHVLRCNDNGRQYACDACSYSAVSDMARSKYLTVTAVSNHDDTKPCLTWQTQHDSDSAAIHHLGPFPYFNPPKPSTSFPYSSSLHSPYY